jgi:hypothetical protein
LDGTSGQPPSPHSSAQNPNESPDLGIGDRGGHQRYIDKVMNLRDFNDAFELVKAAVEQRFNMHRAGLSLVLQGLPGFLGAYHVLGSNMIIVNKRILNLIRGSKSVEQYNSFLFTVLTHEYLHSFGITDEHRVRNMTHEVCRSLLGEDHPATVMARYEPWAIFPELASLYSSGFDNKFEVVKEFDKKGYSYIS